MHIRRTWASKTIACMLGEQTPFRLSKSSGSPQYAGATETFLIAQSAASTWRTAGREREAHYECRHIPKQENESHLQALQHIPGCTAANGYRHHRMQISNNQERSNSGSRQCRCDTHRGSTSRQIKSTPMTRVTSMACTELLNW